MRSLQSRPDAGNLLIWSDIPTHTREILRIEGINSPADWRAAGNRRLQIFGVTPSMRRTLDSIAQVAATANSVLNNTTAMTRRAR